jgi:hypothetical protein
VVALHCAPAARGDRGAGLQRCVCGSLPTPAAVTETCFSPPQLCRDFATRGCCKELLLVKLFIHLRHTGLTCWWLAGCLGTLQPPAGTAEAAGALGCCRCYRCQLCASAARRSRRTLRWSAPAWRLSGALTAAALQGAPRTCAQTLWLRISDGSQRWSQLQTRVLSICQGVKSCSPGSKTHAAAAYTLTGQAPPVTALQ